MPAGFAAASALEQILGAIGRIGLQGGEAVVAMEQVMGAIAQAKRKMEVAAARWDDRLVEGLSAVMAEAAEREERLVARLLADAEEREKRLSAELLSVRSIENELAQRAQWEAKQWGNLSDVMGLRQEDIRDVKRSVDGIAKEMARMRAMHQGGPAVPAVASASLALVPAQLAPAAAPARAAPEAMEGVVATATVEPSPPQEDPVEEWGWSGRSSSRRSTRRNCARPAQPRSQRRRPRRR